jgi:hypothetical protein
MNDNSKKKQFHIFSAGKNIGETYKVAVKNYSIDRIIVFVEIPNNRKNSPDTESINEILKALKDLEVQANQIGIEFLQIKVFENDINDVMEQVFKLRDEYPDASFYFNLTGGRKVLALNLFTTAIWIGGFPYYIDINGGKIEFNIPRIAPEELQNNRNLLKILGIVHDSTTNIEKYVKVSDVYDALARNYEPPNNINNNGRYKLPRGTLSKWIRKLIENGLLTEEYLGNNHKSKYLTITRDGEFALIFFSNK